MMTLKPLPFIKEYIRLLNSTLKEQEESYELTITFPNRFDEFARSGPH